MQKLEAHNVFYKKEKFILNDFSFSFENKLYGIISDQPEENSGVLKVFAGLLDPERGNILLNGRNVFTSFQKNERAVRKQIGFVFQRGGLLSNLNVLENLLVPYDFHFPDLSHEEKMEKIVSHLKFFNLDENILSERPAKVSISIRKALLFIRTYLTEPNVIFYDDPYMNCTQHVKKSIIEMIFKLKEEHVIQIFSESIDCSLYELADNVLIIKDGGLHASGSFSELKNSNAGFAPCLISHLFEE